MWDRKLWGVEFSGLRGGSDLIGTAWMENAPVMSHEGEPARALLFSTRKAAREWCVAKMKKYEHSTDCCATWRFRPVRVRETVTIVEESQW